VGSLRDRTWILGLADYRVIGLERQTDGRLVVELERRGIRRSVCSGCTRRTGRVRDAKVRTGDDLPWAEHPVTLRYTLRRLWCRCCGVRAERVGFADPHARLTRRFRQRIGLDCQSMPTSHAAVRHVVSWGTARRAEHPFLEAWDRTRRPVIERSIAQFPIPNHPITQLPNYPITQLPNSWISRAAGGW